MLLCASPLPSVDITFKHGPGKLREWKYVLNAKDEGGVTLGQFAAVFCKELSSIKEYVKRRNFNMCIYCYYCHQAGYCKCS